MAAPAARSRGLRRPAQQAECVPPRQERSRRRDGPACTYPRSRQGERQDRRHRGCRRRLHRPCLQVVDDVRAREAANVLADLIETAADLHTRDLADQLTIPAAPTTSETGRAITIRLTAARTTPGTKGAEASVSRA